MTLAFAATAASSAAGRGRPPTRRSSAALRLRTGASSGELDSSGAKLTRLMAHKVA